MKPLKGYVPWRGQDMTKPVMRAVKVGKAWNERAVVERVARAQRRRSRHNAVLSMESDLRRQLYVTQNLRAGAVGAGPDGLTPAQRRRIRHKENAGRGA